MTRPGAVAEWLGRGLQSLAHQFDSGRRLAIDVYDVLTDLRRGGRVVTLGAPSATMD
jgi:hypothetical protein